MPGVFWAEALPLSASRMIVAEAARRRYFETMSSTPFPATHFKVKYRRHYYCAAFIL
jgi:hypothetical protein